MKKILLLPILLLIMPAIGNAEMIIQPGYDTVSILKAVLAQIVQVVETAFDTLKNNPAFESAGQTIMYMLFAIVLVWNIFQAMVGKGMNQFIEDFFMLFVMFGLVQAFLWAGGIGYISGFIDSVAGAIAGNNMSSITAVLTTVGINTFNAINDVLTMPSIDSNSGWTIGKIMSALPMNILNYLAKLIAAAFIVIGAAIYMANTIIAYGSIMIAVALAPIMIPWLLLPATSFLFDGWLKFFISSCMYKVVGAFFILMTNSWISGISTVTKFVRVDPEVDALGLNAANVTILIAVILLSMISAYLMMQIPAIASGLIAGMNRSGFSGASALTGGVGGKLTGAATKLGIKGTAKAGAIPFKAGVDFAKKTFGSKPGPAQIGTKVKN